jgi:hypothetical protein
MANTMNKISEGDFKSLKLDDWSREMLEDAYKAVTKANRWAFLRRPDVPGPKGFMFSNWAEVKDIDTYMEYGGHSGSSYGMVMRVMEYIAKNGWDTYVESVGRKHTPVAPAIVAAAAVDKFLQSNPATDDLTAFANAMQSDPNMRARISDIDEQAEALKRFAEGKISYFEMRSRCG